MRKHIFPVLTLIFLNLIFFGKLFFPEPQLFYTPDFGRSDIWNFNYPLKDFLSSSLKQGQLPFWSKDIGTGFPVFAEGQIGALFLPNLILFGLLPTWLAWNLNYLLIFTLNGIGSYLFFHKQACSKFASLVVAVAYSFSAFIVVHIIHTNAVQAISLFPWLLLASQKTWSDFNKKNLIIFSLLLSQQIFAGYLQYTFISLVSIMLFLSINSYFLRNKRLADKFFHLFIAILFGIALSAPQLLPTLELALLSRDNVSTTSESLLFPFPVKHFASFINPNVFGTAKNGSYPAYNENWGIFWENTAYLGILPLIFAFITLLKTKKSACDKTFVIMILVSLVLIPGKYSPLKYLFLLPGFGSFRIPSRFLLVASFFLSALAAIGIDSLKTFFNKNRSNKLYYLVMFLLLLVTSLDIFNFSYNYHPVVSVKQALEPPKIAGYLNSSERISLNQPEQISEWNQVFLSSGWTSTNPYLYFKNGLDANLNLLFNLPQNTVYAGLAPLRHTYQAILNRDEALNSQAVKYFISPSLQPAFTNELVAKIDPPESGLPPYFLYKNPHALARFRFAQNLMLASNLNDYKEILSDPKFSFNNNDIIEASLKVNNLSNEGTIKIVKDSNQKLVINSNNKQSSLLIIADSFYPGWHAFVNGKRVQILAANLNQRAILLPEGTNEIILKFLPFTFYLGCLVSLLSLIIFSVIKINQ
jgi:hypothetical protein